MEEVQVISHPRRIKVPTHGQNYSFFSEQIYSRLDCASWARAVWCATSSQPPRQLLQQLISPSEQWRRFQKLLPRLFHRGRKIRAVAWTRWPISLLWLHQSVRRQWLAKSQATMRRQNLALSGLCLNLAIKGFWNWGSRLSKWGFISKLCKVAFA